MEKRVQLRGHCQHCGRLHAANPMMAKHGYTIPNGWFQGVCSGAEHDPLEVSRVQLDDLVASLGKWANDAQDEALKLEQKEIDPEGTWETYSEMGHRKRKLKPYGDMPEWEKNQCRKSRVWNLQSKAKQYRQHAEDLLKLAEAVHGQPLKDVMVDKAAKAINVGDTVKVCGQTVVVTKIAGADVSGVGHRINGTWAEHVYWVSEAGNEYKYPKRYARKVMA